jgi:hypothetical protein
VFRFAALCAVLKCIVWGSALYPSIVVGFPPYGVDIGLAALKTGSEAEPLSVHVSKYIDILDVSEHINRDRTISGGCYVGSRKVLIMLKSNGRISNVALIYRFAFDFVGIGESRNGRQRFSQECFDSLSSNDTCCAANVGEGEPYKGEGVGGLTAVPFGLWLTRKEFGQIGRLREYIRLFSPDRGIDGSAHFAALPEHCSPLEQGEDGECARDEYERMTIGRLLVSAACFSGGWFVALAGTAYVDNHRRRLGVGLIAWGAVCSLFGMAYWLALPMLR